jgi:hypothetical protein
MVSLRSIKDSFIGEEGLTLIEIGNKGVIFTSDAVVNETYSRNSSVTTYPTEDKNDISEHAMSQGFSINVQGVVSDASLSYFNVIEDVASSFLGGLFEATSKSQAAWDKLNKWMDEGTALDVKCNFAKKGFRDKPSGAVIPFVIESLSVPRNASTGESLRYTMNLKRIRQVQIGAVSLISSGFAILDKGQQQKKTNSKSAAAAASPAVDSLRDNKVAQTRVSGYVGASN